MRNEEMARNSEALILEWDGTSSGSASMLRFAFKYGLQILDVRLTAREK